MQMRHAQKREVPKNAEGLSGARIGACCRHMEVAEAATAQPFPAGRYARRPEGSR
jgi:hypothetical protein